MAVTPSTQPAPNLLLLAHDFFVQAVAVLRHGEFGVVIERDADRRRGVHRLLQLIVKLKHSAKKTASTLQPVSLAFTPARPHPTCACVPHTPREPPAYSDHSAVAGESTTEHAEWPHGATRADAAGGRVDLGDIWVIQGLLGRDALRWVELEAAA